MSTEVRYALLTPGQQKEVNWWTEWHCGCFAQDYGYHPSARAKAKLRARLIRQVRR